MKKIIITAALLTFGFLGYSQTYTKIVQGADTLLKVVTTATTTDTLKRSDLKALLEKMKLGKQNTIYSRAAQKAEFDRLEIFYNAEIIRIKELLDKTD